MGTKRKRQNNSRRRMPAKSDENKEQPAILTLPTEILLMVINSLFPAREDTPYCVYIQQLMTLGLVCRGLYRLTRPLIYDQIFAGSRAMEPGTVEHHRLDLGCLVCDPYSLD